MPILSYQHINKERKKVTKKERNHYYYFCKLFSGRDNLDNGHEDIEAKKEYGRIGLREIKIQRITEEAMEQGGILHPKIVREF